MPQNTNTDEHLLEEIKEDTERLHDVFLCYFALSCTLTRVLITFTSADSHRNVQEVIPPIYVAVFLWVLQLEYTNYVHQTSIREKIGNRQNLIDAQHQAQEKRSLGIRASIFTGSLFIGAIQFCYAINNGEAIEQTQETRQEL